MNGYGRHIILILTSLFFLASCGVSLPSDPTSTPRASATELPRLPTPMDPVACLHRYSEPNEFLHIGSPSNLWWVDSGDFNGDGYGDILLSRGLFQSGESVEPDILLNNGNGSFERATADVFSGEVPIMMEPREVVIADFSGDGRDDIFFADQGMDRDPFPGYQDTLVLSAPGGRMIDATANLPQQSGQAHSAAGGDIDGDGDIDLFVGNMGGGGIPPQILVNDGTGTFTIGDGILPREQTDLSINWYLSSLFADINNDSHADLILGQGERNRDSHVLLNDGTGHFSQFETPLPSSHFAPDQFVYDIQAGDITGDGYLDLLLLETRSSYVGWYIQVLINNGDGTFIAASPGEGTGEPRFFRNNGEGVFERQQNVFNIEHSYLWELLDINLDGVLDAFWSYPRGCQNTSCPEIHFIVTALGCQ